MQKRFREMNTPGVMRCYEEALMKKKILPLLLACMIGASFLAGCASKSASSSNIKKSNRSSNAAAETVAETTSQGMNEYAGEVYENADDIEFEYGDGMNKSANEEVGGNQGGGNGQADKKADVSKEMLVFRCTMAIDTLNFDETVSLLKTKINEYHGFVENEHQSDGGNSGGRYVIDEEDKDYYYTATIRIPSEYYESFVSSAEGIGTLRSKNSSVDNVATRYGTLKNELEIFEAEYDRYLKQYNETQDEQVALEIQRELRNLAITISDIKSEMSMLESDVAYSYVTITIHKVSEKEIKKEEKEVKEEDSFGQKLKKTAKQSWDDFVGFLEGIVLFLVSGWWVFLLLVLIALAIFLFIRHGIKKGKKKAEARRIELEAQQRARMAAMQQAQAQNTAATAITDKKEDTEKEEK
jgi:hypothetical protein